MVSSPAPRRTPVRKTGRACRTMSLRVAYAGGPALSVTDDTFIRRLFVVLDSRYEAFPPLEGRDREESRHVSSSAMYESDPSLSLPFRGENALLESLEPCPNCYCHGERSEAISYGTILFASLRAKRSHLNLHYSRSPGITNRAHAAPRHPYVELQSYITHCNSHIADAFP